MGIYFKDARRFVSFLSFYRNSLPKFRESYHSFYWGKECTELRFICISWNITILYFNIFGKYL